MKRLILLFWMSLLLTGCATTGHPTEAAALRNKLFTAPFPEARAAGNALLRLPVMKSESKTKRDDIVALLGRSGRLTNDAICYKTNGGPLWIDFRDGVLIHAALVAPPRWRGTDEELATWWERTRNQQDWYQY